MVIFQYNLYTFFFFLYPNKNVCYIICAFLFGYNMIFIANTFGFESFMLEVDMYQILYLFCDYRKLYHSCSRNTHTDSEIRRYLVGTGSRIGHHSNQTGTDTDHRRDYKWLFHYYNDILQNSYTHKSLLDISEHSTDLEQNTHNTIQSNPGWSPNYFFFIGNSEKKKNAGKMVKSCKPSQQS